MRETEFKAALKAAQVVVVAVRLHDDFTTYFNITKQEARRCAGEFFNSWDDPTTAEIDAFVNPETGWLMIG